MKSEFKLDKSIDSFWQWFELNSSKIRQNLDSEVIINELDTRIYQLGKDVSWEVGPGVQAELFLAISPNLNPDLLHQTVKIVASAPLCEGWEFYPAKPPKDWDLKWVMQTKNGTNKDIDANEWKYVLFEFEDGTYGIDVVLNNLENETEDFKYSAVEIAISSLIGEHKFLLSISDIKILDKFQEEYKDKANLLVVLKKHMLSQELSEN